MKKILFTLGTLMTTGTMLSTIACSTSEPSGPVYLDEPALPSINEDGDAFIYELDITKLPDDDTRFDVLYKYYTYIGVVSLSNYSSNSTDGGFTTEEWETIVDGRDITIQDINSWEFNVKYLDSSGETANKTVIRDLENFPPFEDKDGEMYHPDDVESNGEPVYLTFFDYVKKFNNEIHFNYHYGLEWLDKMKSTVKGGTNSNDNNARIAIMYLIDPLDIHGNVE